MRHSNLSDSIALAVKSTEPGRKRLKALSTVQWVLRTSAGLYVTLSNDPWMKPGLSSDVSEAVVYDGRDNEKLKADFFTAILKVELYPELISCAA